MTNFISPEFPISRLRRLRRSATLRDMLRETRLTVNDLIYPLFVVEGEGVKNEISSMPGQFQMSIENIVGECGDIVKLGIKAILLFGIPAVKDELGSGAYD